LDRRWIHWVCLEWSKRVAGIITGAITRPARTSTIGSSIVARVAGRAGVAWIIAGFTDFVAGEVKWSKRVAGIITGAITRSASTPTSGSSIVARVARRAGIAWIVAGFTGLVAREVKCSERVVGIIRELSSKTNKPKFGTSKSVRKEQSTPQDKNEKKTNRGENKTNSRPAENIEDQSKTRQDLL
jgi:hypothetical protein